MSQAATHNNPQPTNAVIDADELGRRYGLSPRAAAAWLRKLPHVRLGRRRFTSEAWLASWMVANMKNPPRPTNCDPLRADAIEYGAWAIGELVRQGKIHLPHEQAGRERSISHTSRPLRGSDERV